MSALWVVFYSVRGGVGRSTSLSLVALELARRGHRVAAVDFDLESPGLDVLLTRDKVDSHERVSQGVVDFLDARARGEAFNLEDIILPLELPGDYTGRLFLVPAGRCDDEYLAALDRLDLKQLYERSGLLNPVRQLRAELEERLDPDVVLVDSRTGYSDAALVSLFDLADAAVIVMVPDLQNVERLAPVLQRLVQAERKPQLLLVANKCQSTPPAWRAVANIEARLHELVPVDEDVDEVENPFLYKLPYLSEFTWVQRLLPPPVPSDALRQLASRLDMLVQEREHSLPPIPVPSLSHDNLILRRELVQRLRFGKHEAELDDRLFDAFVLTRNVKEALKPERWLVRGAWGAGRTAIFRLLTERPSEAKRYCPELADWHVIPAHSSGARFEEYVSTRFNSMAVWESIQKAGATWEDFWRMYAVLRAVEAQPTLATTEIRRDAVVWMRHLRNDDDEKRLSQFLAKGSHFWREEFRNLCLGKGLPKLMFVYDDVEDLRLLSSSMCGVRLLGVGSESLELRQEMIAGLFHVWTTEEALSVRDRMVPKILIRENIFRSMPPEMFFRTWRLHDVELRWESNEIANCVVARAKVDKEILHYIEEHEGLVSFFPEEAQAFSIIFDERVGIGHKRARTWQMLTRKLADADGRLLPADFLQLAIEAQRLERQTPSLPRVFEPALIAGTNVRNAIFMVSHSRVARLGLALHRDGAIENEKSWLHGLRGLQSPFHEREILSRLSAAQQSQDLEGIWNFNSRLSAPQQSGHYEAMMRAIPHKVLMHLKWLGVVGEWADGRLFVADLYLEGLGMHRAGFKAQDETPPESDVGPS